MVKGLKLFSDFFNEYQQYYILIGGSACDLHFEEMGIPFRATQDLDIVLCIEALNPLFVQKFWDFIHMGKYQIRQRSDGQKEFYRFLKPQTHGYPAMLELFARRPNILPPTDRAHLTPIPTDSAVSSLSAILLNEDYYRYILSQRTMIDNIPVVSTCGLIILKAKAWMDLKSAKEKGASVDSKNIRKHKNDIADLLPYVVATPQDLPEGVRADMQVFYEQYRHEDIDLRSRKIPSNMTMNDLLQILALLFGIQS